MKILTPGLTFEPEGHVYTLNGSPILGVTRTLKLAGFVSDEWYTQEARDRGSAVHAACHYDDEGDLDEATLDPRALPYLEAWRKFRRESGMAPIALPNGHGLACEIAVASPLWRVGATVDRVMARGTEPPSVVEIKTGEPGDAAALQTAAQQFILLENGISALRRFAVELTSAGTYKIHPHSFGPLNRELFLAGLRVAYWKLAHGKES